jgi:hypothetical protein
MSVFLLQAFAQTCRVVGVGISKFGEALLIVILAEQVVIAESDSLGKTWPGARFCGGILQNQGLCWLTLDLRTRIRETGLLADSRRGILLPELMGCGILVVGLGGCNLQMSMFLSGKGISIGINDC